MKKKAAEKTESIEPKGYAAGIPVFCAHDAIVSVEDLIPNPANPNKHSPEQVKKLGAVIRGNGWRNPITVSTRSGMIVKGHGRLLAAQLEELSEVPVDYQSYDSEVSELADLWADNYIAELSETDQQLAASLLAGIQAAGAPLELAGSSQEEYEAIIDALAAGSDGNLEKENEENEDTEPAEVPEKPITIRGDVWILGNHRVMCGDARSKSDVAELLQGEQPEILITDPPYCSGGFQESSRGGGVYRNKPEGQKRQVNRDKDSKRRSKHQGISKLDEVRFGEQPGDSSVYFHRLANVDITIRHSGGTRHGGEINDSVE